MVLHRGWLTVVLLVLAAAGCKGANEGTPDRPSEKLKGEGKGRSLKQQAAELVSAPAEVKRTADELGKELNKLGRPNHELYKGKVIELSGVVHGMGRNIFLDPWIMLAVKDEIVQLTLVSTAPGPWDKAAPGQRVKLKAIFLSSRPGENVTLFGGPILEVSGKPTPTVTAEELAKEYQKDRKAANAKYRDLKAGGLIITGEISEAIEGDPQTSVPVFYLKTGTKLRLHCSPDRESARGLRPGMRVKLMGYCWGFGDNNTDIRIVDCLVTDVLK
jgi:hypothetical protein